MSEILLCGACSAGRPDDCSGWCGVDPSTATSKLADFTTGGTLTIEDFEAAMEKLLNEYGGPCGSEGNPHITPLAEVGVETNCVYCGHRVVYTSEDHGIDLTDVSRWFL